MVNVKTIRLGTILSQLLLAGLVSLPYVSVVRAEDGKEAFVANKCSRCHSIETHGIEATIKSEKMRGPDLSDVGSRHDAEWIQKYVRKEVQLEEKNHKSTYKGSDEALAEIAAWLAGLKES